MSAAPAPVTVTFSYSADGSIWGLRKVYSYDWNLDDPMVHEFGVSRRMLTGIAIEENDPFEEMLQLGDTHFSTFACPDAAEIPDSANYFAVRLAVGGEVKAEVVGIVPRSELGTTPCELEYADSPIRSVRWNHTSLDSVVTAEPYNFCPLCND